MNINIKGTVVLYCRNSSVNYLTMEKGILRKKTYRNQFPVVFYRTQPTIFPYHGTNTSVDILFIHSVKGISGAI